MKNLFDGFDTGICTLLPSHCYPLDGVVTIKDKNDNTVTVGTFRLYRGHETLRIDTNVRQVFLEQKMDSGGKLYCQASEFLNDYYKYELVAKAKINHKYKITTNVQINGIGKFSGDFEISAGGLYETGRVIGTFYPIDTIFMNYQKQNLKK